MMRVRSRYLFVVLALGIGLSLALVWLAGGRDLPVALAQPGTGVVRVATTGNDAPGCGGEANPCRTVQCAVDEALSGEEIRVASGIYTGVNDYGGLAQVVYLSKTLTLQGGYTVTNWTTPDPVANPTTLDAEGAGRVLVITGTITPTIEGLRLTRGDATGLGGSPGGDDAGGGVYLYAAAATISNCLVYSNTASTTSPGFGGGLALFDWNNGTLSGNRVVSNTASSADSGWGGGLYLGGSAAILSGNAVRGNTASSAVDGHGSGLFLWESPATLSGNTVAGNTATNASSGGGGGLYLSYSPAMLSDNMVINNVGSSADSGWGGGLFVWESAATLSGNTVQGNAASVAADGSGGGLWVSESDATLEANIIVSNTAALSPTAYGCGGGLRVEAGSSLTLTNNVVAGNQANGEGSGLWLNAGWGLPTTGRLLHNTIAHNAAGGGSGQGVYVGSNTTLAFTNTIVAGHEGAGVFVDPGGTATMEATLWHDNGADTGGDGSIITGTVNAYGDPAFVDPTIWDYHLTVTSAAIDAGLDAGVVVDMDGDPRPDGAGYDIGADEYDSPVGVTLAQDRCGSANPGSTITYTHTLTNTGNGADTFALSHASSQGWAVAYEMSIALAAGQATTLVVTLTVPAEAISGTVDSTVITATSQADPGVLARAIDTTVVLGEVVERWDVYLPVVVKNCDP